MKFFLHASMSQRREWRNDVNKSVKGGIRRRNWKEREEGVEMSNDGWIQSKKQRRRGRGNGLTFVAEPDPSTSSPEQKKDSKKTKRQQQRQQEGQQNQRGRMAGQTQKMKNSGARPRHKQGRKQSADGSEETRRRSECGQMHQWTHACPARG